FSHGRACAGVSRPFHIGRTSAHHRSDPTYKFGRQANRFNFRGQRTVAVGVERPVPVAFIDQFLVLLPGVRRPPRPIGAPRQQYPSVGPMPTRLRDTYWIASMLTNVPVVPTAFGAVIDRKKVARLVFAASAAIRSARTFSMRWIPLSVSRMGCTATASEGSSPGITSTAQVSAPTATT